MAPSRALLFTRLRASPHIIPCAQRTITSCTQAHRSRISPALSSGPTRTLPALLARRCYATATPEAPTYLNEAERQIFNKIKAELQPVKLEVCAGTPMRSAYRGKRGHQMMPQASPIGAGRVCTSHECRADSWNCVPLLKSEGRDHAG